MQTGQSEQDSAKQGGKEVGRQGGKEAGRQGSREAGRQGGKEGRREGGKEAMHVGCRCCPAPVHRQLLCRLKCSFALQCIGVAACFTIGR